MTAQEDYEIVLTTLTEDIEPSASRTIAITSCHRLGSVVLAAREIEGRIHYVTEGNLCPLCQSRMGKHRGGCALGRLRAALEEKS